jgi:hypothetical protein
VIVKNELRIFMRVIEIDSKKQMLSNTLIKAAFPTVGKAVKEKQIVVSIPDGVSLPDDCLKAKHVLVEGALKIGKSKYGGTLFSIIARNVRAADADECGINEWTLNLVLDKRLANKEKTAYWSAYHVTLAGDSFPVTIRSGDEGAAFSEFRPDIQVIVSGKFDMVYNGILRKTTFYIDAGAIREAKTDTVPIPLEYSTEHEKDVNSYLSQLGVSSSRVFESHQEVMDGVEKGEFTPSQCEAIESMYSTTGQLEKVCELKAAEKSLWDSHRVARAEEIDVSADEEGIDDGGGDDTSNERPDDSASDGDGGMGGVSVPDPKPDMYSDGFDILEK